jgi:hypothetical protein
LIGKVNPYPTKTSGDVVSHSALKKQIDLGLFTSHAINICLLWDGKQLASENCFDRLIV